MKERLTILFLFLSFCGLQLPAEVTTDSSFVAPTETRSFVVLELDKETYESFKDDKKFDYYSYEPDGNSLWEYLKRAISSFLDKLFQVKITPKQADVSLWVVVGIVVVGLIVLIIVFKPSLFYINKKKKTAYQVEEDSIEGMNFDKLIRQSLDAGDYTNAIRWKYLYTLNALQEKELISWNPNKTINEYVREMKRPDLKPDFKNLSLIFLYCRYGNWNAEQKHFNEAEEFSNEIVKRLQT